MSRKTIYYHDPLHDDFAPTNGHIRPKPIGADFPYEHPSPVWQALAFVVYRLIMTPFLFLYCKLVFGLRIENRKALRALPSGTSSAGIPPASISRIISRPTTPVEPSTAMR